ncbi:MAG TPA: SCP2 sterol-binding domain-containing protein [Myxococcaceae bacterium]|nr:SCP2 sterol-binding domain-containing protein [Myxococcaceae bacterium]
MPVFPSRGWAEAAMAMVNADPEIVAAGRGWTGDFGVVIDAEAGKLDAHFVAWVRPEAGRIAELRVLVDPDDLDEFEPAYRIRAPYSVWKGLLLGEVDPVEAILERRLRVDGDVQPILERMRYKDIASRVLSQLETRFIDE